jgi:hypothetical protein
MKANGCLNDSLYILVWFMPMIGGAPNPNGTKPKQSCDRLC